MSTAMTTATAMAMATGTAMAMAMGKGLATAMATAVSMYVDTLSTLGPHSSPNTPNTMYS